MLVPGLKTSKDYKSINWDKEIERRKSSTRCKVEHAFLIAKQQIGYSKVACRGIAKNLNQFFVLFGCANLIMCIRGGICVFSFEFGWVAITLKERGWLFNCFLGREDRHPLAQNLRAAVLRCEQVMTTHNHARSLVYIFHVASCYLVHCLSSPTLLSSNRTAAFSIEELSNLLLNTIIGTTNRSNSHSCKGKEGTECI